MSALRDRPRVTAALLAAVVALVVLAMLAGEPGRRRQQLRDGERRWRELTISTLGETS